MNPGPAPRPPGDRPRLNLTPAVANIPGNVSTIALTPRGSSTSLSKTGEREGGGALAVVKEGPARIKEEGFMRGVFWSEKWLILRETQLDFHKSMSSPKISFSIALKDVTAVNRCDTAPMSFEILRLANPAAGGAPSSGGKELTKTVICKVDNDSEVYSWIDEIYARCPGSGGVSNPTNFAHQVHVGYDPTSGTFVGLPPEWEKLLNSSAITKEDYKENPTAVIEVLNFYTEKLVKRHDDPSPYTSIGDSIRNRHDLAIGTAVSPPRSRPQNGFVRDNSYEAISKPQHQSSDQVTPINDSPMSAYGSASMDARLEAERRRRQEDETKREQYKREQRDRYREKERRDREDQAAYSSALPPMRTTGSRPDLTSQRSGDIREQSYRANPSPGRPGIASSPSGDLRQAPSGSLRQVVAQRPAPAPPSAANGSSSQAYKMDFPYRDATNSSSRHQESPTSKNLLQQANSQTSRLPANVPKPSTSGAVAAAQAAQAPKPLNVTVKQPTGPAAVAEAANRAEQEPRQQTRREMRMSAMTESEVMHKLREVVSREPPLQSYNKQKKIGQGASGSVYVAKIRENAISPFARAIIRDQGPKAQVAIKQMDLRNQPRKELIVNEIVVMKDSKHPNIVNFIEAFLPEEQTELWVVMEFMEGGPLTDVIDNNPTISEGQIATICYEVGLLHC